MIQAERIKHLNQKSPQDGKFVLYWMQASQRAEHNHALEFAIRKANDARKPLVVFFGITTKFPEDNARHYYFLFLVNGLVNTLLKITFYYFL